MSQTKPLKFTIIGTHGVGKTTIIRKFIDEHIDAHAEYIPTIGLDFECSDIMIDGEKVSLQIWDTAGQEKFAAIINTVQTDVCVILLTYSITQRSSFEDLNKQVGTIEDKCRGTDPIVILIGNKSDSESKREVTYKDGQAFMEEKKQCLFLETSAVDGTNIKQVFEDAARKVLNNERLMIELDRNRLSYNQGDDGLQSVDDYHNLPNMRNRCKC